jgi:mannonate dehydratase
MAFEQTWRWFGPNDPVTLKEIRQTGATGIVTALHHIRTGEIWPTDEIQKRKAAIEAEGLTWSVAESLPVHENIKKRGAGYRSLLENYKASIRNLGKAGVTTICYNFMPVLDWSRTDLEVEYKDGSITSRFDSVVFAAFDLHQLRRPGAETSYDKEMQRRAREHFDHLSEGQRNKLLATVLLGFPGSGEAYTLEQLRRAIQEYRDVGEEGLRRNLRLFLEEIIPVAEEAGVLMGIHPDDPPWPLLGLPRIVSSESDIAGLLEVCDSPANGITLCTGSLGACAANDLVAIAERFASRVNFVHLRNVSRTAEGNFLEEDHLGGDIDIFGVMKTLLLEQQRRMREGRADTRLPMRPDHGHLMLPDRDKEGIYSGYSLFGRMRGLAELRGLEMGILRSLGLQ